MLADQLSKPQPSIVGVPAAIQLCKCAAGCSSHAWQGDWWALPLHCPVNACCSFTSSKHFYTYSCLFIDHNAQGSMTQAEHSKEGAPQIIEGEAAEKAVFKRLVGQCLEG